LQEFIYPDNIKQAYLRSWRTGKLAHISLPAACKVFYAHLSAGRETGVSVFRRIETGKGLIQQASTCGCVFLMLAQHLRQQGKRLWSIADLPPIAETAQVKPNSFLQMRKKAFSVSVTPCSRQNVRNAGIMFPFRVTARFAIPGSEHACRPHRQGGSLDKKQRLAPSISQMFKTEIRPCMPVISQPQPAFSR